MSEELNINALELEDNSFVVLPEGDYKFVVASHEIGISNSDKLPSNTKQIIVTLEVPSEQGTAKVRHYLNVYKKALFAIRQFSDCIGLTPEHGKATINLDNMDGKTGVCHLISQVGNNGNEYNHVATLYVPSKAPLITENDDAFEKWNNAQFTPIDPGVANSPDMPF